MGALAQALRDRPTILVLEDLHWADGATLDVLRLLARRIDPLPVLVVATYRDDELHHSHPLRMALGELPVASIERVALAPLSLEAVALLAGSAEIDAGELHRRTSGNPFYVSEALAAGGGEVPETVRDAVLARAARLDDDARTLLDAVAIEPARAELWLLEALLGGEPRGLDACLASGMLRAERNAVSFRHEIARVVIEEALSPHRRMQLSRRALGALTAAIGRRPDLARLAHHAEAADDAEAVLRYAPAAAERACDLGSHREAEAQFARAVRFAGDLPGPGPRGPARALVVRVLPHRSHHRCDRGSPCRDGGAPERGRPAARGRCASLALATRLVRGRRRGGRRRGSPRGRAARAARDQVASSRWPTATTRSCGC